MSEPIDPWDAVAAECPRKILKLLHSAGHYHHGTCLAFPGKVLCVHRESSLFERWEPTSAQLSAEKEVRAGLLKDDSPAWCVLGTVETVKGSKRTVVTLEDIE